MMREGQQGAPCHVLCHLPTLQHVYSMACMPVPPGLVVLVLVLVLVARRSSLTRATERLCASTRDSIALLREPHPRSATQRELERKQAPRHGSGEHTRTRTARSPRGHAMPVLRACKLASASRLAGSGSPAVASGQGDPGRSCVLALRISIRNAKCWANRRDPENAERGGRKAHAGASANHVAAMPERAAQRTRRRRRLPHARPAVAWTLPGPASRRY